MNLKRIFCQVLEYHEAARLEEQNKVFLNADKVESFMDLIESSVILIKLPNQQKNVKNEVIAKAESLYGDLQYLANRQ